MSAFDRAVVLELIDQCATAAENAFPSSGRHRLATRAEMNIARAWVVAHRWTNPRDVEAEYLHALALLVFANARPPLKWK
jgi:hypothetical protein